MVSHQPRHLKQQPNALQAVAGRRGVAIAATAAAVTPVAMSEANAAPVAATPVAAAPAPAAAVPSTIGIKTAGAVTVRYGSTGYYVRVLQQRLGVYADGVFGWRTRTAVINFQARKGLVRDGVVGAATWSALGGFPGGSTGGTSRSFAGSSIVGVAKRYIGVPYVWGGSTPRGFDCSGYTQYVYRQVGKYIPRTASAQQAVTRRVSTPGSGDLFFTGWPAHHVGIYVGNGLAIDARKPGTTIQIHTLWGVHNYGRM